MKTKKIITIMAIVLVIILIAFLCYGYYKKATEVVKNPIATIEVENFGTIKIELYPDMAPNTVAHFIMLANREFYNGLTFHRTVPNFMIQGGDKNGNGTGSPMLSDLTEGGEEKLYAIEGEFIANGFNKNTLRHEEGVLSMARSDYTQLSGTLTKESYNSAGSQFFIMTKNTPSLNGLYTPFGKVIEGMEVVHNIENVEVVTRDTTAEEGVDKPVNPPKITSITVETYGIDYGMPKTVNVFNSQEWIMNNYGSSLGTSEEEDHTH
ncbi:MAG: peptidylprolyl isomerase [Clostridia bacterium]|jgi:peptidyl-prolyl cis-trans isomerase B (cyclophilin B)|nr:peptidylprolyl isomerase [Clostridia bacterium]